MCITQKFFVIEPTQLDDTTQTKQCILCPFRHTTVIQLLCLMTVEAVKLAQAGFGDFLADTGVSRLKGKRDGNKEVYCVGTICNSAGHK